MEYMLKTDEGLLYVDRIGVYYADLQVLWDVELRVNEGEIVSLIGPNGAGKSTLLRTIAGIHKVAYGKILYKGVRIDVLPAQKIWQMGVALVPEGRGLFTSLRVIDNLKLAFKPLRKNDNINYKLKYIFELFPILEERKNQIAGTLSGGEQQMLAISKALMSSPEFLMLDEPSLGLAPKIVEQIFKVIKQINKEDNITILLVEQYISDAIKNSNSVYVLEAGKVVACGDGQSIIKDPRIREIYLGL